MAVVTATMLLRSSGSATMAVSGPDHSMASWPKSMAMRPVIPLALLQLLRKDVLGPIHRHHYGLAPPLAPLLQSR